MNKIVRWSVLSFLILGSSQAQANLSGSDITKMVLPAYAVYVTSDPTCMTGLVATRSMTATPHPFNFAAAPSLGRAQKQTGGIQCIIIVAQAKITLAWQAGTYTTQTHFGTSTFNDSNCNAGSGGDVLIDQTAGSIFGCYASRGLTVDWPAQIVTDMTALGMSYPTVCNSAGAANIFPIYISSYSKCTGNTDDDTTIGGSCDWQITNGSTGGLDVNPGEGYRANTIFQAPTAANDAAHGVKLGTITSGASRYKLVVDPIVGGDSGGAGCGVLGPPKVTFQDP